VLAERFGDLVALATLCECAPTRDEGEARRRRYADMFGAPFERVVLTRYARDPALRVRLLEQVCVCARDLRMIDERIQPDSRRAAVASVLSGWPSVAWLEHVRYTDYQSAANVRAGRVVLVRNT
jgi:hypothetical protein